MTTTLTTAAPGGRLTRSRKNAPLLWQVARSPSRIFRFFFSRRGPWMPRLVVLLAVAYAIMPVDLIPDIAPVIGWLDDAGFAGVAFAYVMKKFSEMDEDEPQTAALTSS